MNSHMLSFGVESGGRGSDPLFLRRAPVSIIGSEVIVGVVRANKVQPVDAIELAEGQLLDGGFVRFVQPGLVQVFPLDSPRLKEVDEGPDRPWLRGRAALI